MSATGEDRSGRVSGEGEGKAHLCALEHIEVPVRVAALIKVVVLLLLVLLIEVPSHPNPVVVLEPIPLLPLLLRRSPAIPPSLQGLHLCCGRGLCVSVARRRCSLALALRASLRRALGRLAFCRAALLGRALLGRALGRTLTLRSTLGSTLRRRLNSLPVCGRHRFGFTVGGCALCSWRLSLCGRRCLTLCSRRCVTLRGCLSYGIIRRSLRSCRLRGLASRFRRGLPVGRDPSGYFTFLRRHAPRVQCRHSSSPRCARATAGRNLQGEGSSGHLD